MSALSGASRPYVAVIGGSSAALDVCQAAEEIGRELARNGAVVVCGGLGGVMAAACRGAKSAGGLTVGILPGATREETNAWVDVAVPTGLGEARNALVVRSADALVAVGGEFGTLSEIALALKLGKPVVGIGTWELAQHGQPVDDVIVRVDDPTAAAQTALRLAQSAQG